MAQTNTASNCYKLKASQFYRYQYMLCLYSVFFLSVAAAPKAKFPDFPGRRFSISRKYYPLMANGSLPVGGICATTDKWMVPFWNRLTEYLYYVQ